MGKQFLWVKCLSLYVFCNDFPVLSALSIFISFPHSAACSEDMFCSLARCNGAEAGSCMA
jgi:hypothetical protein